MAIFLSFSSFMVRSFVPLMLVIRPGRFEVLSRIGNLPFYQEIPQQAWDVALVFRSSQAQIASRDILSAGIDVHHKNRKIGDERLNRRKIGEADRVGCRHHQMSGVKEDMS